MISPYVRRLRLAAELRGLRAASGLTHNDLAKATGINRQMLSKIENGHVRPDPDHILSLLEALGVTGEGWTALVRIANDAATPGWWEPRAAQIGERQALFANLEAGAATIREYQQGFAPGLLQTRRFTAARLDATHWPLTSGATADGILHGRAGRQRLFRRPDGPAYEVVLDEVAVRRRAAPAPILREQLLHLADLAEHDPQVTVRVLPIDAELDGYDLPVCSYSIYTYPDPADPVVVALEAVTDDQILTDPGQVTRYRDTYALLRAAALPAADGHQFIRDHAATLETTP